MLNLEKIKKFKSSEIGFFRFKKFDKDTYLITNDIAKYSFLTKEEFGDFIEGKIIDGDKYDELLEKGFIKDKDFEKNLTLGLATKNKYLDYGPSLHIIVTTLRCNHKCKYCHAAVAPMNAKDMDMTEETARKVVDTIFYTSNPNITIEFQGGEALVNWEIVKFIVEYAEIKSLHLKKSLQFALVTNLTLMDDEKLDYILEHNIGLTTSLDGDEETHNFNRTYSDGNSFEEVTKWIKKINQAYKDNNILDRGSDFKRIGALVTVTKKTLGRYKELIDTYTELGLNGLFLRPLNPYGFAASDLKTLGYSSEEFFEFYKKSMDYIIEMNKNGKLFLEMFSNIYLHKMLTTTDPNFLDERSPCGAGIGQVAYNFDGKIYTCDEGRMLGRMGDDNFLIGQVEETGKETYNKMINSEVTKIMIQSSTLDGLPGYNDNVYKPYIGVCPINSYKMNGNIIPINEKDERTRLSQMILDYLFEKIRDEENIEIFHKWLGKNKFLGKNKIISL